METKQAVTERPINLRDWEVRAILDGRKTQKRVPILDLPKRDDLRPARVDDDGMLFVEMKGVSAHKAAWPFGGIDRWWVREAFDYVTGRETTSKAGKIQTKHLEQFIYRADGNRRISSRWTAARNMPPFASRLSLDLVTTTVERLQSVSSKGILAEGVVERAHHNELGKCPVSAVDKCCYPDLLSTWCAAWMSMYGKDSWDANPWVWALTFRVLSPVR